MNGRDLAALELAKFLTDPYPASDVDEWRQRRNDERLWRLLTTDELTSSAAYSLLARECRRELIILLAGAGAPPGVIAELLGKDSRQSVDSVLSRARSVGTDRRRLSR